MAEGLRSDSKEAEKENNLKEEEKKKRTRRKDAHESREKFALVSP